MYRLCKLCLRFALAQDAPARSRSSSRHSRDAITTLEKAEGCSPYACESGKEGWHVRDLFRVLSFGAAGEQVMLNPLIPRLLYLAFVRAHSPVRITRNGQRENRSFARGDPDDSVLAANFSRPTSVAWLQTKGDDWCQSILASIKDDTRIERTNKRSAWRHFEKMNNERAMASIECIAETLLHYRPLLTFTRKTGDDLAYRIVLICFAGSLDLFAQKFTWNY